MNKRLKNAPHLNDQPHAPLTDLLILAGSKAWSAWNKGEGTEFYLLNQAIKRENQAQKPIILGGSQLAEIDRLRIAPENQRYIKIAVFGELSQAQKTAICLNLAKHTEAQIVEFITPLGELIDNLSAYILRLRESPEEMETAQAISETTTNTADEKSEFCDYFKTLADNQKLAHFLKWYKHPIRYDDIMQIAYIYTGKKWESADDTQLGRAVRQYYEHKGINYNKRKIENLIGLIQYTAEPMGKRNTNLLGFKNGVLNKKTGEFSPHNERHFLTSFIDIDYSDKAQETPNFNKWIEWVSKGNPEKRTRILAGLYMILTNRYDWHLFLEITGAGGTGKSVFNDLAIILAGEDNSTAISLREIEDEKARVKLIDKTLFYSADQEAYIGDGAELRKITGGDHISINPKYKQPFDALITAVFLMTNNTAIIFKESKGGIARRRVIFQFNDVVPNEQRDYKLKQKLKAEAGGIVRLLLDTFKNPIEAKKALEAQRESTEARAVKIETDHVLQFAQHFKTGEETKGLKVKTRQAVGGELTAIYNAYLFYCDCVGYTKPLNRVQLLAKLGYSFKELGQPHAMRIALIDNTQRTNIYYTNQAQTMSEWRGD